MLNQQDRHRTVVRWMGSHWLVITIAILTMALGLFTLAGGQPVQAASEVEFNQTVPPPTPRPPAEPTKPTPAPDNNDNNDDDSNNNNNDDNINDNDDNNSNNVGDQQQQRRQQQKQPL